MCFCMNIQEDIYVYIFSGLYNLNLKSRCNTLSYIPPSYSLIVNLFFGQFVFSVIFPPTLILNGKWVLIFNFLLLPTTQNDPNTVEL